MTVPEANSDIAGLAQESRNLLDAYRIHFDIWKLQNDNYFKRVQVLMVAVQAALFAAALKLFELKDTPLPQSLLLIVLSILGVLSAQRWIALNEKQNQYMEFCRRSLRNLEHRLGELGVPLRYFTLEAHVFGPPQTEVPPATAGTSVQTKGLRHIAKFTWSGELYPDQDKDNKGVHGLAKVAGGMISFEKSMATGIRLIWILVLIGIAVATIY